MKGSRSMIGTAIAVCLLVTSGVGVTAQEDDPSTGVPAEFTGQKECGPQVRTGTEERFGAEDALSFTSRGYAWQQRLEISDPRLEGTVFLGEDLDQYRSPEGLGVATSTLRIENEEGAWQGSSPYLYLPDGTVTVSTFVLTGEGAYEGLTAIWEETFDNATCSSEIRGAIIAGEPPAAPEPYVSE